MHHVIRHGVKIVGTIAIKFFFKSEVGRGLTGELKSQATKLGSAGINKATRWYKGDKAIFNESHAKAVSRLDKVLESKPTVAGYIERGVAKFKMGNPLGASDDYQRAKELDSVEFQKLAGTGLPGLGRR